LAQSAARHEAVALLLQRWLREAPDLPVTERAAVLKQFSAATDRRDACLEKLGLSKRPESDPLTALYGKVVDSRATELYGPPPNTEPPTLGEENQQETFPAGAGDEQTNIQQ
jgi:hypothetical protein